MGGEERLAAAVREDGRLAKPEAGGGKCGPARWADLSAEERLDHGEDGATAA